MPNLHLTISNFLKFFIASLILLLFVKLLYVNLFIDNSKAVAADINADINIVDSLSDRNGMPLPTKIITLSEYR